ncbi:MAG: hypothetical protein QXI97_08685 [Nitrososphaerota archaeon]
MLLKISEEEDDGSHHKLTARNHAQGTRNLSLFLNLFTPTLTNLETGVAEHDFPDTTPGWLC